MALALALTLTLAPRLALAPPLAMALTRALEWVQREKLKEHQKKKVCCF